MLHPEADYTQKRDHRNFLSRLLFLARKDRRSYTDYHVHKARSQPGDSGTRSLFGPADRLFEFGVMTIRQVMIKYVNQWHSASGIERLWIVGLYLNPNR